MKLAEVSDGVFGKGRAGLPGQGNTWQRAGWRTFPSGRQLLCLQSPTNEYLRCDLECFVAMPSGFWNGQRYTQFFHNQLGPEQAEAKIRQENPEGAIDPEMSKEVEAAKPV